MAHLVANPVGAPAESEFRQIAGSDHPAPMLAGQAEQVIRPEARLHVLERRIIDRLAIGEGMTDILEHQPCGGLDVDLLGRDADRLHQFPGVRARSFGRTETGHRVSTDRAARQAKRVAGPRRHQQGMGTVEPARNTDDERFGIGGLDAADECRHLYIERLVTVIVQFALTIGNEGKAADRPFEADVPAIGFMVEGDKAIPVFGPSSGLGCIVEGLHPHPLIEDALAIDVSDAQFGLAVEAHAFDHQLAQFVDHPLPVPGEVRGALAIAAGRIGICADRARGTGAAEEMPFVRFADHDVGG